MSAFDVDLHRRYADHREPDVEEELLRRHDGLALSLANRFAGRGEPIDELVQVARVALWLALTRFDPDRGMQFSTFATPTIVGELRRHFRDRSWLVRPPRMVQERHLELKAAADALESDLARAPTPSELAAFTALSEDEVIEGLVAGSARRASNSLDAVIGDRDVTLLDSLDGGDGGIVGAEAALLVGALLERLCEPARTAVELRYLRDSSHREIADRLGVSQMTVARTIERALERLRLIGAKATLAA